MVGSRSMLMGGNALQKTVNTVRENGIKAAAFILGTDENEVDFEEGVFFARGTNRSIGIFELNAALARHDDLPDDMLSSLSASEHYSREAFNFPNGCHMAEVEIDSQTGEVKLQRYVIVDDFGRILNPLIASGQVLGGSVQGIGQALLEGVGYDIENGQLLTGSFMDYGMPRADDICALDVELNEKHPTKTNPLGVKGTGEAGATGAPSAIVNAVCNALAPYGISHIDMPLTPLKIWQAIEAAKGVSV